jgi:hypothetical protein
MNGGLEHSIEVDRAQARRAAASFRLFGSNYFLRKNAVAAWCGGLVAAWCGDPGFGSGFRCSLRGSPIRFACS